MGAYVLRRLAAAVPMLALVCIASFFLLHWLPGDPVRAMLGQRATAENVEQLRKEYGLDKPKTVQFWNWLGKLSEGDFGESHRTNQPVLEELKRKVPATIELTFFAMIIAVVVGVSLGILAAIRPRTIYDFICLGLALIGVSLPIFWLGFLAQKLFAGTLKILPFSERLDIAAWPTFNSETGFFLYDALFVYRNVELTFDVLAHLTLPALVLSTVPMALIARMTRANMLEVLGQDYIRTARAKGLSARPIIVRHAMRNAMIPVVTSIGMLTGYLLGGAVLTESVFSWPGLGTYTIEAITFRDGQPLQASVLLVATVFIVVNLLTDLSYAVIDPRLRHGGMEANENRGLARWQSVTVAALLLVPWLGLAYALAADSGLGVRWTFVSLCGAEFAVGVGLWIRGGALRRLAQFFRDFSFGWVGRLWILAKDYLRFSLKHKPALIGGALIGVMVFSAIFANWIAPYGAMEGVGIFNGDASSTHLFGTTAQGRDLFSRIVYGARTTLLVALAAMTFSMVLGSLVGALAGYFGGLVDLVLMRLIDFMMSFPSFFLAMIIVTLLDRTLENLIWAVGIVGIPLFARQIRAEVMRVKAYEFIEATRALGFGHARILAVAVLPNCLTPITVLATLGLGSAILDVAGLGFLGLGGDPFVPEWGMILKAGWDESSKGAFQVLVAGGCILLTVLGFNLLGDGLRDWLDPRTRLK